jgi:hypothetical protein
MAKSRRAVAEELLDHLIEHAAIFAKVDTLKDKLREFAIADKTGFNEAFDGKGEVKCSKASVKRLKGIMPTLLAESFLQLSEVRREKLIADGIVKMEEQWTEDRKPSVSVSVV